MRRLQSLRQEWENETRRRVEQAARGAAEATAKDGKSKLEYIKRVKHCHFHDKSLFRHF